MSVPRLPTMNVPAPRPPLPKIALEEAFAHKATMTLDANGNLYGATEYGGTSINCQLGCGVVWEITP